MKTYLLNNKKYIKLMLIGTLYLLSFMLTRQIININTDIDIGKKYVIIIYSICSICTALGYALFYVLNKSNKNYKMNNFIIGFILLPSMLVNILSRNTTISVSLFVISALCYGYIGGYVCYFMYSRYNNAKNKGTLIGISLGTAVLLQVLISSITQNVYVLFSIMYSCVIVFFILCGFVEKNNEVIKEEKKDIIVKKQVYVSIVIIVILASVVGIQDGLAVRFDSLGHANIYGALKLSYIFGSICSGIICDIKKGKYYELTTICVEFITIMSLFFIKYVNMYNYHQVFLYFCTGYFIVYSILTFMQIAASAKKPMLWAGMGRLIACLTIGISIVPANYLFDKYGANFIIVFSLILVIPSLILFYLNMHFIFDNNHSKLLNDKKKNNLEEFLNNYSFTNKEKEVCRLLIEKQLQIKELAFELNISPRSIQRYLTSIYTKTATSTKIELINLYYNSK